MEWLLWFGENVLFVISALSVFWMVGTGFIFALQLLLGTAPNERDSFEGDKLIYRS